MAGFFMTKEAFLRACKYPCQEEEVCFQKFQEAITLAVREALEVAILDADVKTGNTSCLETEQLKAIKQQRANPLCLQ